MLAQKKQCLSVDRYRSKFDKFLYELENTRSDLEFSTNEGSNHPQGSTYNFANIYRPKRSFGQGNIFRSVCHSVHRGGVYSKFSGGVSAPNFLGGNVCSKFLGEGMLQIFGGGVGVSAPNFRGGVWSWGGVSNFRNMVNVRLVRILLECILVPKKSTW